MSFTDLFNPSLVGKSNYNLYSESINAVTGNISNTLTVQNLMVSGSSNVGGTTGASGSTGATGATGANSFTGATGAVIFSNGSELVGDSTNFNWNDANGALLVNQPSSVSSLNTVLKVISDPSGAHGHGAHLEIAGNPAGGGTIFRTDGGFNNSALQIYGGDYSGTQGGSLYLNGNNSTSGDAGGAQFVLGLASNICAFQVLDPSDNVLISVNPSGSVGQVMIPSLNASSIVLTDSGQNLVSTATLSGTATAGSATLPSNPISFLPVMINGIAYKIALYNP
jgi:hypothetical protein